MRQRVADVATGVRLPYAEHGDADGVPVLLLHGMTDSWRSYELVLPHLPPWIRALAVTQRGHGDATRPETGYSPRDFTDDAAAFLDALGIDAAYLVGHSSHGLVAQRFAIERPARTKGLVLIAPPAAPGDHPGLRGFIEDTVSSLADPIDPAFVREFVGGTTGSIPADYMEAQIRETMKMPARVWRACFEALLAERITEEERARITAPTLVIWGDADELVPRDEQEMLARVMPRARLIVYEGVGHAPNWERPERFAADVAAFVEESEAG